MTTRELLSALADGELDEKEFSLAIDACRDDGSALHCWNTYHLIGEALRLPAGLPTPKTVDAGLAFVNRLNQRLAQEPQEMAPASSLVDAAPAPRHGGVSPVHHRGPASNDGNFRWKLVACVASLAAVSAIAWNTAGLLVPVTGPQLAQVGAPQIVVSSPQGPILRDARLEELLAAHRQFGTASALQESSGFLRNAVLEMPLDRQAASGR